MKYLFDIGIFGLKLVLSDIRPGKIAVLLRTKQQWAE